MTDRAKSDKSQSSIESKSTSVCYVCGKTLNEVKTALRDAIDKTAHIDKLIIEKERELKSQKTRLETYIDHIIKNTKEVNLEFKLETVVNDRSAFAKLIPNLSDLLEVAGGEGRYGRWSHTPKHFSEMTLARVRNSLLKLKDALMAGSIYEEEIEVKDEYNSSVYKVHPISLTDYEKYKQINQELSELEARRESHKAYLQLAEREIARETLREFGLDFVYGSPKIGFRSYYGLSETEWDKLPVYEQYDRLPIIHICRICAHLFPNDCVARIRSAYKDYLHPQEKPRSML